MAAPLYMLLGGLAACATLQAQPSREPVRDYARSHERQIVRLLSDLSKIPSVAANPSGLVAEADRLESLLKERGFKARQLSGKGGPPVVVGTMVVPGARRTVVFYAHYDGQPVTPSQWATPPFDPVMRSGTLASAAPVVAWETGIEPLNPEWRLFARAASDDKASIVAFLTAFDALKSAGLNPAVNLKVVWEGEEEANSPHLGQTLQANKELLAGDLWLIGDGPVHQSRTQMIYFGARGTSGMEMTIYGPLRPLHDGHYGNWVPNPAVMAAELISQLRDSEGHILIPRFDEDVTPLIPAEKAAIEALPPVEDELRREFGLGRTEGTEGLTASLMRPALNIRGLSAGQVGAEATNSIPAEAVVSIDFRLVPGQTAAGVRRKMETFLTGKGWTLVDRVPDLATRLAHARIMRISWSGGYRALRTDMSTTVAQAVIAAASKAAGRPVTVLPMMGGSVPIYLFDDIFSVPVIGLPIVNHDNSQHAPNENLRLQNLWDGIDSYAAMMHDLSW